ncbi:MAG TPA: hypothetical protein VD971_00475 [Phycisphaerales bacterium]|nr:hypothetical protein [Phycisphaerales bacterium]
MRPRPLTLVPLVVLLAARVAAACTVCAGDSAVEVRAGVLGPDAPRNLIAAAAPFLVLGLAVAVIHGPPRRREHRP